jgi:serine/threonine protein kinase
MEKDTLSTMSQESQVTTIADAIYMDFYEENLEEYLIRKGKLEMFEILCLIRQILYSVQSLHKIGIVHRDIKPANFMIEKLQNGQIKTKLIDFGESTHVTSNYDGT